MDRDDHQEILSETRYGSDQLESYTHTVSVPNDPDVREPFNDTACKLGWIYVIFGLIILIVSGLTLSLLFDIEFLTNMIIEISVFVVGSTIYWILGFMLMKKHFDLDPTNTNVTDEARDIIKQKRNFFISMIFATISFVILVLSLFGMVIVLIKTDDVETFNSLVSQFVVSFSSVAFGTSIAIQQCVYSWKTLKQKQRPSEEANDGPMVNAPIGLDRYILFSTKQKITRFGLAMLMMVICFICLTSCLITIFCFLGAILGEDALVPASVRYQRFGIACAISILVLIFTIYIVRKIWRMLEDMVPIPNETDEVVSEESNVVV